MIDGVVPSDFVAWTTREKGQRIEALGLKIGVPIRFDPGVAQIKTQLLAIERPDGCDGILRSPRSDLSALWKLWRKENPKDKQFRLSRKSMRKEVTL